MRRPWWWWWWWWRWCECWCFNGICATDATDEHRLLLMNVCVCVSFSCVSGKYFTLPLKLTQQVRVLWLLISRYKLSAEGNTWIVWTKYCCRCSVQWCWQVQMMLAVTVATVSVSCQWWSLLHWSNGHVEEDCCCSVVVRLDGYAAVHQYQFSFSAVVSSTTCGCRLFSVSLVWRARNWK